MGDLIDESEASVASEASVGPKACSVSVAEVVPKSSRPLACSELVLAMGELVTVIDPLEDVRGRLEVEIWPREGTLVMLEVEVGSEETLFKLGDESFDEALARLCDDDAPFEDVFARLAEDIGL